MKLNTIITSPATVPEFVTVPAANPKKRTATSTVPTISRSMI